MNCHSEQVLAIYADRELPDPKAREIEIHLAECGRCHHLLRALQFENQIVAEVLKESESEVPTWMTGRSWQWFDFIRQAAPAVAAAVLLHFIFGWVEEALPNSTNWINPMNLPGQSNWLFTIIFFLTKIGETMASQILTIGNVLASGIVIALAGALLWRHHKWLFRSGLGLLMVLFLVIPGFGFVKRTGKANITVAANETIDDSLFASGDSVRIDGTVNGDVFAFGRQVVISGTVKGDLISWAQRVEVRGSVEGNTYTFAQSIDVGGSIGRNLYGWMQTFHVEQQGTVNGDVVAAAADVTLDGKVLRSLLAFGGTMDVHGEVGRDLTVYAGEITLSAPARVGGDLTAYVHDKKNLHVGEGVSVAGKTETKIEARRNPWTRPRFYFWKVVGLLGAFIVGGLLLMIAPGFFHSATAATRSGWRSLGLGFAVLVGAPVALVIIAITLIGLPLAFLGLMFYLVGIYLAKVFVGAFIGDAILRSPTPSRGQSLLGLLIGLVIILVLFQLPYGIGALAHLAVYCFGLGAMVWQLYRLARPVSS